MGKPNLATRAESSDMKLYPVEEAQDVAESIQPSDDQFESSTITAKTTVDVPFIPYDGTTAQMGVDTDAGHNEEAVKQSSGKRRKGKTRKVGPVISSWSLRSRSQEKQKSPEPSETAKEFDVVDRETVKRGRKRKLTSKNANEFSKIKNHLRYLLQRIKYEQSMIDAYSAEGWKGQSVEKLKPEKELKHARSHILRYKLKIRALFENLDKSLGIGKLPESLFDSKGEIDSEDIFCAKCGSKELTLENDIILCDGACVRGFHQYCLEPPLLKEDIPPGDEDWLCPGCDCKLDCIDLLMDFHSTKVSLTDSWENIFHEAARASSGINEDAISRSSDDSEDDDYDPEKPEVSQKDGEDQNESGYFSAPDDLVLPTTNEINQGLPSEDSEDDDFDPSVAHEEKQVESESSDFTSDSEDLGALLEDESQDLPPNTEEDLTADSEKKDSTAGAVDQELSFLEESAGEPVSGRRNVERLDYKKLHDEAYENSSSDSSDEDFEETITNKGRRASHVRTRDSISPDSMDESHENSSTPPKKGKRANTDDPGSGEQLSQFGSSIKGSGRPPYRRLGEAVKEKLYASFLENKYPERPAKEKLANELGISFRQVSKWFENARWSFNHRPQGEKPPDCLDETQEAGAVASSNCGSVEGVEISVGNGSVTTKTRKRKGN